MACSAYPAVPTPHLNTPKPQWVLAWPSSSTGAVGLGRPRQWRSNFPKGLRLISSHTGAEREESGSRAGSVKLKPAAATATATAAGPTGSQAALTAWVL
jgi:hypothetical protein